MTPTRLAWQPPGIAGIIVIAVLGLIIFGLLTCRPIDLSQETPKGDLDLYQQIAERVQKGESYYQVAGEELRAVGYPVQNVFQWRLPFHAWFLGLMPRMVVAQGLAIILSVINLALWMTVFHQSGYHIVKTGVGSFALAGLVIFAIIPSTFLSHELWAGILIALSLGAWGRGWRATSVAFGLLSLLFRELSLPFVGIMLVLAWCEGNRKEGVAWLAGIVIYAAILALHWWFAAHLMTSGERFAAGGWMRFQGWSFVLNTAQMNPYLMLAPAWLTAFLLPLFLLGLGGWPGGLGLRVFLTVEVYVLSFAIVGQPFNIYWGVMYASLAPLGLMHLPATTRDLLGSLYGKQKPEKG